MIFVWLFEGVLFEFMSASHAETDLRVQHKISEIESLSRWRRTSLHPGKVGRQLWLMTDLHGLRQPAISRQKTRSQVSVGMRSILF
jgi:hypothetical protein